MYFERTNSVILMKPMDPLLRILFLMHKVKYIGLKSAVEDILKYL